MINAIIYKQIMYHVNKLVLLSERIILRIVKQSHSKIVTHADMSSGGVVCM
jgi:hypothetical protein